MDADRPKLKKLAERALREGGSVPLALWLELAVPVRQLRAIAARWGVAPKGFRAEAAPAPVLAALLAETTELARMEEVVALLFAKPGPRASAADSATAPAAAVPAAPAGGDAASDLARTVQFREQELQLARADLERARQTAARSQEREDALRQQHESAIEQVRRLRAELQRAHARPAAGPATPSPDRDLEHRVHELEQEIRARDEADAALRRQLALDHTRTRELEEEVAELEALLPKGRRKKPPPEPPPEPARFLLPYLLPSFYRSLDGKDRRSIERALHAVLLFCTEGHAYPGLDVKQLGGQDTWSLRASLGLRIYFRHRDDGDVEFLELADREEQHTTLRRLKER